MHRSCLIGLVIPLAFLPVAVGQTKSEGLRVHTDFPGGSAEVVAIDPVDHKIQFKIPQQPNGGWQSWWFLKVTGFNPGQTFKLELQNGSSHAGKAVYSRDGKNWDFTPPAFTVSKAGSSNSLYTQKVDGPEAWFAWYVPYLPAHAEALADQAEKTSPHAKKFLLCKSEAGIPVWGIKVSEAGSFPAKGRPTIWVQARQHAWEVGGSWVAHGFLEWLVSDDPRAKELRQRANIVVIPIMDVDSVFRGLGGKNQRPHDHNRDWHEKTKPIWNAVAAAKGQLEALDKEGKLDLFIDLHDPGWNGGFDFWCHMYNEMGPERKRNTDRFMQGVKAEVTGPLKSKGNVVDSYPITTPTSGIWACRFTREHVVGGTFEIGVGPPAGYKGKPVEYHLLAGKQMGLAIERYVREDRGAK